MQTAHLLTTRTPVTQLLSRVMLQPRTQRSYSGFKNSIN